MLAAAVHALSRLLEVFRLGFGNIHKFLRVAVHQRKPSTLNLQHNAMAAPKRMVVQGWDSIDQIKNWYNGADYQAALKIGQQYATFRRIVIPATE